MTPQEKIEIANEILDRDLIRTGRECSSTTPGPYSLRQLEYLASALRVKPESEATNDQ